MEHYRLQYTYFWNGIVVTTEIAFLTDYNNDDQNYFGTEALDYLSKWWSIPMIINSCTYMKTARKISIWTVYLSFPSWCDRYKPRRYSNTLEWQCLWTSEIKRSTWIVCRRLYRRLRSYQLFGLLRRWCSGSRLFAYPFIVHGMGYAEW